MTRQPNALREIRPAAKVGILQRCSTSKVLVVYREALFANSEEIFLKRVQTLERVLVGNGDRLVGNGDRLVWNGDRLVGSAQTSGSEPGPDGSADRNQPIWRTGTPVRFLPVLEALLYAFCDP